MAIPVEHAKRDYEVYLRGPVGNNTFAFGTVDQYRGGVQHVGMVVSFPEPVDNAAVDFGFGDGGGFTVEIADEGDNDWYWLWESGDRIVLENVSGALITEY